ncbi:MAG: hypothetical protein IJ451_04900 [Ruminococcus sp.]|nr:hypothetical protein [Ruminococcus sp.]
MKRLSFILCIITFALIFTSCKSVNLTSADELLSKTWHVTNQSGICGELKFDVDSSEAELIIKDSQGIIASVCGVFAVDKDNFYITSTTLCKTYTFGYKVYKDRVVLSHNDYELTFTAINEKEP